MSERFELPLPGAPSEGHESFAVRTELQRGSAGVRRARR
jgi:hypothetical protein